MRDRLDAYMKAQLFNPMGMTSSGCLYREGMARPMTTTGTCTPTGKRPPLMQRATARRTGCTRGDRYATFLIEFVDPKPADAFRLSAARLNEMVQPQVKATNSLSWGLGWAIEHNKSGADLISHGGDNPGLKA